MAIKRNNAKENNQEARAYTVKVERVREIAGKRDSYRFNLLVNGVFLNGMKYITYAGKDGKDEAFIGFPNYKGNDEKYYNICYFPVNDPEYRSVFEDIERQIGEALDSEAAN